MKTFYLFMLGLVLVSPVLNSQEKAVKTPYYFQIPEPPESYTAGAAIGRMVDGLGFRYYWATETLSEKDLNYKPTDSSRTTLETLDHIYTLSKIIVNATENKINDFTVQSEPLEFIQKREATLENIKRASINLKKAKPIDLEGFIIIFKNNQGLSKFPYWYNINGPIADALWHTGQVVLLRRASGNPFNSKISVLQGKLRD